MRYCAKCEMLSREAGADTCAACGEVLAFVDEVPPDERDRLVVLTTCDNPYEAKVLRAALAAEGVDAIVEDEGLFETISPFHVRAGGDTATSRVMVRLEDAEAALEFLRQKDSGELAIDENTPEPSQDAPADEESS